MTREEADKIVSNTVGGQNILMVLIGLGLFTPFEPCAGCDGYECDWKKGVCAYPGAALRAGERRDG